MRRSSLTRALAILLFLCAATFAIAPATGQDIAGLDALKQGGYVVLMRHAQTVPGTGDPEGMVLGDCSTQRNLDERGKKQAADLRKSFRAAGVAFSWVLSSPWCRCMDTARLVAPEVEVEASEALASSWRSDQAARAARAEEARRIITEWRGPGNLLMVTHYVNASAINGAALGSGRFVVIEPATMQIV